MQAQSYYPEGWVDVRRYDLGKTYKEVMPTVDDGYDGRYSLVKRKEDDRIFVKKHFSKHLVRSVKPRRWLREVRVLRDIRHKNIQCYMESYLCTTYGDIYLEYCNYGPLSHFKRYMNGPDGGEIPEAFVWRVVEGLTKALCFMHDGIENIEKMDEVDPYEDEDKPEWTAVLHCDITIDCVFLKTYRNEKYPVVKLGKFNSGVHQLEREYINQQSGDAGTDGWVPPEHPHKSERGDVFQAAAVVQCLCDPEWEKVDPEAGVGPNYSKELNDFVKHAMTSDKKERPYAIELAQDLMDLDRVPEDDYVPVPEEAFERILPQPY